MRIRIALVPTTRLRHHVPMRLSLLLFAICMLLPSLGAAQNWKQVHKQDEAKWEKATGLDSLIIHKIWRAASQVSDERDDDSRIANLDLDGLAERHHVLLVTYAGEKNCLTLTVFNRLTSSKFVKLWSVEQSPDGSGFCDTAAGAADAGAANGAISVRVAHTTPDGSLAYTAYVYEWNGVTYRFAGQAELPGK